MELVQFLSLLLVVGMAAAEEAKLLASKFMLSNYAVEGKDFVVDYNIYNVGDVAAVKVTLADEGFPAADFEVMRGLSKMTWDRIAPGANVSHSIILRPKNYGYYNLTTASLTYLPTSEATELRQGYTSSPGETFIYRLKDYERKFSPKILDWVLFALMSVPSLGLPCLLWFRSKSKYDKPVVQSKKGQ